MVRVWGLLAGCMSVGALVGWSAMRATLPGEASAAAAGRAFLASGDLADLVWPADMTSARVWGYIVIHHSATRTATVEAIRDYHVGIGFEGVGYHFVINNGRSPGTKDGEITPTARWYEQRAGAHARIAGHPEYNSDGIGICLVGNFENEPPTADQMVALERLVLRLRDRYDIALEDVVGHGELKNTACPGRRFPMESFLMDLRQAALRRRLQGGSPEP
jgi:N-acetyl-anhydromuramyl-L-alanine amidase AmpD